MTRIIVKASRKDVIRSTLCVWVRGRERERDRGREGERERRERERFAGWGSRRFTFWK